MRELAGWTIEADSFWEGVKGCGWSATVTTGTGRSFVVRDLGLGAGLVYRYGPEAKKEVERARKSLALRGVNLDSILATNEGALD